MLDSEKSLNDDFVRQRRNLIISTIFVYFIHHTTIEIDKLSIFGISFDIVNKSNDLLIMIYTIWIYFFYRYMQYIYDIGMGVFVDKFKSVKNNEFNKIICPYIEKEKPEAINFRDTLIHLEKKDNSYFYNGRLKPINENFNLQSRKFKLEIPKSLIYRAYLISTVEIVFFKSTFTDILLPSFLFLGVGASILF